VVGEVEDDAFGVRPEGDGDELGTGDVDQVREASAAQCPRRDTVAVEGVTQIGGRGWGRPASVPADFGRVENVVTVSTGPLRLPGRAVRKAPLRSPGFRLRSR
jgi:hypothetical protein